VNGVLQESFHYVSILVSVLITHFVIQITIGTVRVVLNVQMNFQKALVAELAWMLAIKIAMEPNIIQQI
jgi:hypothetical protein